MSDRSLHAAAPATLQGEDGTTTVKVALQPTSFAATYFVAKEQGYFEDAGITVEEEVLPERWRPRCRSLLRATRSSRSRLIVPIVVANSQGLPVKMVAPSSLYGTTEEDAAVGIIVPGGSSAKSAADPAGETVAVPGLKAAPEQLLLNAVEADGGDPASVKLVQMDYPTGFSALDKGDIDGMIVTEPFITQAASQGYQVISYPELETSPGGLFAAWFASTEFLNDDAETAEKFIGAIEKANEYATAHPEEVNAIVAEQQQMPKEAEQALPPTTFGTELDQASLESTIADIEKFGWTRNTPTVADLLWAP
ncbi:ABC transporter substrate-binding protein [Nocardioides sp. B-3]|uniref:ABC transporter substrate-binding protein n=1 Tax=Nocardioides sp. B-3 TaxID=2895565 RepID=UPI0021526D5E|nr:ABC transporter substrate-binding protein [Nocardioides sp. B-3]UUZ59512.1 ABC transporter substrate-binding protein [Nocardioides sp. B-3]